MAVSYTHLDVYKRQEITYLVVPGENDSDEDMKELTAWLGKISPGIPLHLSRYLSLIHI